MINKYTIIWIVLIVFFGLNYNNFINFYYNSFWEYTKTNNVIWEYNLWTESYINSNYENSINSFSGVLDNHLAPLSGGSNEVFFRNYYNLWNSYFRLWEDKSLDLKIELFTKSVENYRESLNIKFDEQTQKNLEFVLEKLRIAKLEQEKEKQEKQEEGWEENEDNWDDKKGEEKNEWWEENKWEKEWEKSDEWTEEWEKQEWWDSEQWKLSEETKKILQQKEEELQKLQEEIWQYYNKNYKEKLDPFSNFDQFFDNSLLDDTEEKDW